MREKEIKSKTKREREKESEREREKEREDGVTEGKGNTFREKDNGKIDS